MGLQRVFKGKKGGFLMQFLTVSQVADFLEVSCRRVQVLLTQGRIPGFKSAGGVWRVNAPFTIKPGKRGPDLRGYAVRKLQPRPLKVVQK